MGSKWEREPSKPNRNNIKVGAAVVPYDEKSLSWVAVSGKKITTRKAATEYAKQLDKFIRNAA